MKKKHYFGDLWSLCHFWWLVIFMSFVIFWLGLGNLRHIATKSQHLWTVSRQIKFLSILKKKVRIGSDPPPSLGQIPNFYRKLVSGAPLNVMSYLEFPASLLRAESDHCAFSWARLPHTPPVRKRQWAEYQWSDFTCIHAERLPQCVDKPAGALPGSCDLRRDESEHLCSNQATSFDLMSLACLGESMEQVLDVQEGRPEDTM